MNVVYAMTHHVYDWALPSMRSLAEHNPDATVYVLAEHDELPYETPMPVRVVNVTGQMYFRSDGVNYNNDFKYINLLKVRYPSLLKEDKVIHLDIDTIVCDSLKSLWETDVEGKWFAAVPESQTWYNPFGRPYWNMGVALINLEQMRKDGIEQPMQDYLNGVKQPFADQDAWNKYATEQGAAVSLDPRWNNSRVTAWTENPGIIHYCGYKDWYTRRDMFRVEYLDKYRDA